MVKRFALGLAFVVSLVSAVAGWSGSDEIFVDVNAAAGGNGTQAAPYDTIRQAVGDANARVEDSIIHIAEGTYSESPNITITRDGVRLVGSTTLVLDGSGLPTGAYEHGATLRPLLPPGTPLIPAGSALIRVNASRVEIAGLVLDGGVPLPPLGPAGVGLLILADGVPGARHLDDIHIHDNLLINTGQATQLRLASATVERNFFARSNIGMGTFAGFENPLDPQRESHLVIRSNRFVQHQSLALNVLGSVGVNPLTAGIPGLISGPSVTHVTIRENDFLRNSNGPMYPQAIQYSALNFNPMNDTSDTLQPSRIDADVRDNRFIENGYGWSISQRVRLDQNQAPYTFDGRLVGNFYCGNGLNDAFFNFNLNAQSHGFAAGGAFRHATNSTYIIDAAGDGLTATAFDYDHPLTDPRLPTNAPGTLVLNNVLRFNGVIVDNAVQISRPPLVSPGVFAPIDVGLTPALSLVGGNPISVKRDGLFVDPGVNAIDPCEGDLRDRVVTTGIVDVTTPGTYVVRYEVTNAVGKSAPAVERTVIVRPPVSVDLFLDGTGPVTASSSLFLSDVAPAGTTARSQDSVGINFAGGNPWKVVGTWTAPFSTTGGDLESLRALHVWLGLKNSDDQGTRFDVRAEILRNGNPIASGETRCIQGLTRNANLARDEAVSFNPFAPITFDGVQDVLSLRISTRIGTTATGAFCGGHSNATGLRLYFDAVSRQSGFGVVLVR